MLQKLKLPVGSFRENRGAERLHDLFDCDRLAGQLIFCRTEQKLSAKGSKSDERGGLTRPVQKLPCPLAASRCTCLHIKNRHKEARSDGGTTRFYLLVISKVVPKIWARTNSAILENKQGPDAQCE